MSPIKKAVCLMFATVIVAGCQQKNDKKQPLRTGRGLRGSTLVNATNAASAASQCGAYIPAGKVYGEVTSIQGDQMFQQEVRLLTDPTLASLPADDQLGYVSGASGQYTGVRFWGSVGVLPGGQINTANSEIRVEIYDDRACQPKADGTLRSVIPVHIGAGQPGSIATTGMVQGGMARIIFADNIGQIVLEGQVSNGYFTGNMYYTTPATGGQFRTLGRFSIMSQNFFINQSGMYF